MASIEAELFEIGLVLFCAFGGAWFIASMIARILQGEKFWATLPFRWLEVLSFKAIGIQADERGMSWRRYLGAVLIFNGIGIVMLFALLLLQGVLPLNPNHFPGLTWDLALNTAVSFVTNTNWQAYSGEASLSYFSQMCGLGVQNFLSAATGIAVMAALARGVSARQSNDLGNFWQDMTRIVVHLLLPLSIVWAVLLISQGVIHNFSPYVEAFTLEGAKQIIPMGPAASQIAIKQLGSNGGGFFGVNSAHPFENPTPFSNFLELVAILLLPIAMPLVYGRMVGNRAHGKTLFLTMTFLFLVVLGGAVVAEFATNPAMQGLSFFEGKELRFGVGTSALWAMATTATSNGSVNAMISSMAPLSGFFAILNMVLGEVIFGGVGCGVYGIVLFAILSVFIAGLMVGRSPEYLGKKIEAREISFAAVGILAPSVFILSFAALALSVPAGLASLAHKGPHGLTEVLYAFSSAAGNNGSAFGGLNANTPFYNVLLSIAMLGGRFLIILPVIAIAGSLAAKKMTPPSPGTMPTSGLVFGVLLCGVILIVGALTFFPSLVLGPIAEHLLMLKGRVF